MKKVIVPQADIDRLEKARLSLHKWIQEYNIDRLDLFSITGTMWHITHRKYPKAKKSMVEKE